MIRRPHILVQIFAAVVLLVAAALAFEIVWFRILVLSFGSTVYSFSAMLSVFLLGIALGSILLGPIADRAARPLRVLTLIQLGVAVFTLAGYLAVNEMPEEEGKATKKEA